MAPDPRDPGTPRGPSRRQALEDRVEELVAEHPRAQHWPDEVHPGRRGNHRGHRGLVVLLVLLVAVLAAEAWYLWRPDTPQPSSSRPVVTGSVETASALDTAARAMQDIVSTSWKNYDEQVEQAASLMTGTFAEEYRRSAEDAKAAVVEEKTEVAVDIVSQGVIQASTEQVQALIFLDQSVTKDGKGPRVTPYRARVTVTRTDQGWLVSAIATQ